MRDLCAMPGCVMPAGHLTDGHQCVIPTGAQSLGAFGEGLGRLINYRFDLLEAQVTATVNAGEHDVTKTQEIVAPAGGDTPAQVRDIPDPGTADYADAVDAGTAGAPSLVNDPVASLAPVVLLNPENNPAADPSVPYEDLTHEQLVEEAETRGDAVPTDAADEEIIEALEQDDVEHADETPATPPVHVEPEETETA